MTTTAVSLPPAPPVADPPVLRRRPRRTRAQRRRGVAGALTSIGMIALAALVGAPFYYIVVSTLKTQQEVSNAPFALPTRLDFRNYADVFASVPIVGAFANTFYVTVVSVALMLLVGSMAAYAMLLRTTLLTRIVSVVLIIAFLVPGQATLIPLYRLLASAGLVDSLEGLILLYAAGSIFCYFLIQGYMKSLPLEIFEAARIDGAGPWQIYWRIVLPLIRPILITVGVFQTMWVWNDFITPNVFISSSEKQTLVLQVYKAVGQFGVNWPAFLTLSVVVLLPMVVFFVLMQKHIVGGLVSGSVKG
ncbi:MULTISPECIES: carbohydrate ABC transporter permease [Rathayibacter]|uniref:Carbohydrate ABC transporter permease n=1 Tax=Rathayibacter caricis DSM 15933 TaxID=1328867 RepID=A0A2T4UWH2_9MICO|nr:MULTISPECIES: carbohydrate ABC transporter permease [Rathayibacter]MCJ1694486.1 carbohydrate ABC transporter permease [Rathayibacter caricis]PTL73868.1 carbohydrate ABC transporter permease [Rathayibacter caricis DSM 15933]